MKKLISTAAATLAIVAFGVGPTQAQQAQPAHTFRGTCDIVGDTVLTPSEADPQVATFNGTGTCEGSVDGRPDREYRVINRVVEVGVIVPSAGVPLYMEGDGSVRLVDGNPATRDPVIRFTIEQAGLVFHFRGHGGGRGVGYATPAPEGQIRIRIQTLGPIRG